MRDPARYRAYPRARRIYDLLHFEQTPNGAYNVPEFGTVRIPRKVASTGRQSPRRQRAIRRRVTRRAQDHGRERSARRSAHLALDDRGAAGRYCVGEPGTARAALRPGDRTGGSLDDYVQRSLDIITFFGAHGDCARQ